MTYDCRLLYILDGGGTITIEGKQFEIRPHMLITFQPGVLYQFAPAPFFSAIAVDFDYTDDYTGETRLFAPLSPARFDKNAMHRIVVFDDYALLNTPFVRYDMFFLKQMLTELCDELNSGRLFFREKASALFKNILLETVRNALSDNKKNKTAEAVLDYIYSHYSEAISNKKIAQVFNYEPCYLNRVIKHYTGTTIHKLILQYRITAGIKLLLSTDMPIEKIAAEVGFYSIAHFSDCCKKLTGIPPSGYRK